MKIYNPGMCSNHIIRVINMISSMLYLSLLGKLSFFPSNGVFPYEEPP